MNMNKVFYLRTEDRAPKWRVIDAQDKVLGRLATEIADILRGKDTPEFTPHTDSGDYVVVINADKVKLTGKKLTDKEYARHTGWMGGYKTITAKELFEKHPTKAVEFAVKGMLPKNKLSRQILKKLKVYTGDTHPHTAQVNIG
jgi:large subunit ribosomal protein L13